MKYPTASEILSKVESEIDNDTLVKIPELVPGKCKILYDGKPLRFLINGERVVMDSSSNSLFDYCPSVKLEEGPTYKLAEIITKLVIENNDTGLRVIRRAKEYDNTKFLDLKLYDGVYAIVRDKTATSEETLSRLTPVVVNKLFKTGSEVTGIVAIGVHVSDKYVSVTASIDSRLYVDRRKVKTHLTHKELKESYGISIESNDDDISDEE